MSGGKAAEGQPYHKTSRSYLTTESIVILGNLNPKSMNHFHAQSDLIKFERQVEDILFGLKERRQRQHRDTQPAKLISSPALFTRLKN